MWIWRMQWFFSSSRGLINLFRPVLRMLGSTWFIDQFVCLGSRAFPSPAGSVHTGVSDPSVPRPAVHNHCAHIHPEGIWTYIKATFPPKVWKTLSCHKKLITRFRTLSSILMPYQAYCTKHSGWSGAFQGLGLVFSLGQFLVRKVLFSGTRLFSSYSNFSLILLQSQSVTLLPRVFLLILFTSSLLLSVLAVRLLRASKERTFSNNFTNLTAILKHKNVLSSVLDIK